MIIKGLQRLTLIDYPGQVACTIFTFGCNFRCPFCYNKSLVVEDSTPIIPEQEILDFLKERKEFLEAVCITGGEPTLHADLPDFMRRIRRLGYLIKLDTNGTNPEMVRLLVEEGLIDYIAMDIKAPWERYEEVVKASVDLRSVKLTFRFILSSGIEHEMRTTVVPGIHSKRDVIRIAKQIKGARVYFIQGFRPMNTLDPKFMKLKPLSESELREMARECNKYIPTKLRL